MFRLFVKGIHLTLRILVKYSSSLCSVCNCSIIAYLRINALCCFFSWYLLKIFILIYPLYKENLFPRKISWGKSNMNIVGFLVSCGMQFPSLPHHFEVIILPSDNLPLRLWKRLQQGYLHIQK